MTSKEFPENYPPEIVSLIEAVSFSGGRDVSIVGSSSLREIRYSADVDCYERTQIKGKSRADALKNASKRFRRQIKNVLSYPLTYMTDFKAGSIEEFVVIPNDAHINNGKVLGYSAIESRRKVKQLYDEKVIHYEEYLSALELLIDNPTPIQFLLAKDKLRFNIIRWSLDEIMKGSKIYRGRKVSLAEAFGQPTIIKLDLITLVDNNRFIELSIIYELLHIGHHQLNAIGHPDYARMLRESILEYNLESKTFKTSKRQFSLLRFLGKHKKAESMIPYFNSDLGLLYSIISDLDTLVLLVESTKHLPKKRVEFELKHLPTRLGGISSLKDILVNEPDILHKLQLIERHPRNIKAIEMLSNELKRILNTDAKKVLKKMRLYPPSSFYLP